MRRRFSWLKRLALSVLLWGVDIFIINGYAQTINTIPDSPKPSIESILDGISSYNFADTDYGDSRGDRQVSFVEYYIQSQILKYMEATCPDAEFGVYYYRPSTEHLRIQYTYSHGQHMARNGAYYVDYSNIKVYFFIGSGHYTYTFNIPGFSVMGNSFPGTMYNHLRNTISQYIHHYNANKVLSLYKAKTGLTEMGIRRDFTDNGAYPYEGIYEDIVSDYGKTANKYKVAVKYIDGNLYLIYLSGSYLYNDWTEGEIKASLTPTASNGVFKAKWITHGKYLDDSAYVSFENGGFVVKSQEGNFSYLKLFPTSSATVRSKEQATDWSGTGFALNNGYIATNYHVVEDAKSIMVYGIKGNSSTGFFATVEAVDKTNDLAIIRVSDSRFSGFGKIPYAIKNQQVDVGEDVWVLGYPLTQLLGNEIKLTTGVISSRSGYQGDVSTYQISAPVQPGNSGGPLFDSKGNIVGIVNAGVPGAENVGYAIKTSYLKNLVDSYSLSNSLPTSNTISSKILKDQVKSVNGFVFLLVCSSKPNSLSSSYRPSASTPSTRPSAGSSTSISTPSTGATTSSTNSSSTNRSASQADNNDYPDFSFDKKGLSALSINDDCKLFYIPPVRKSYTENVVINRIIFTKQNTIFEMTCRQVPGNWCSVDKGIAVYANGTQYKLIRAENIPYSPNTFIFSEEKRKLSFRLYFPAIDTSNIQELNLVESNTSTWRFYGIELKK